MKRPSKPMTPAVVSEIKLYLKTGKYHQHQIAALVGVNQGRVSEVKNGHYG